MTPADALRAAKECILEHGWAQGLRAVVDTERHCMVTALAWVTPEDPVAENLAFQALQRATSHFPNDWNDDPERTLDEVLEAFDRAIVLAEIP